MCECVLSFTLIVVYYMRFCTLRFAPNSLSWRSFHLQYKKNRLILFNCKIFHCMAVNLGSCLLRVWKANSGWPASVWSFGMGFSEGPGWEWADIIGGLHLNLALQLLTCCFSLLQTLVDCGRNKIHGVCFPAWKLFNTLLAWFTFVPWGWGSCQGVIIWFKTSWRWVLKSHLFRKFSWTDLRNKLRFS